MLYIPHSDKTYDKSKIKICEIFFPFYIQCYFYMKENCENVISLVD